MSAKNPLRDTTFTANEVYIMAQVFDVKFLTAMMSGPKQDAAFIANLENLVDKLQKRRKEIDEHNQLLLSLTLNHVSKKQRKGVVESLSHNNQESTRHD